MKKLLCTLILIITTIGFVQAQQDVNLQGNGNDILDASTTPLVSNHTDFENVSIGSTLTRTFTIQNTGGADLSLTGAGVGFNFGFDPQFTISLVSTTSPISGGGSTTFDVTYTPTTIGTADAVVLVTTDDPDVPEQSYTFAITANGILAGQDVNLQGNGNDIIDASTTPLVSNHTDFESVSIGSTLTRTFTIQNTGGVDLSLTGAGVAFNFGFDPQFSISLVSTTSPISGGGSTTFDVTYTPTTLGIANAVVLVTTDDPDVAEQSYTFAITANGIVAGQDVNLQGNGNDIIDASTTPLVSNHTDFESVSIGSTLTRTFTIQNTGTADLSLTGPGVAFNLGFDPQFTISLVGITSPITGGSFTTFDVTYTPTTLGTADAVVVVTTDDPDVAEQSYTFAITANGVAAVSDQLMITQYYEGSDAPNDNSWVEVKNISATGSLAGAYHLALFEDLNGTTVGGIATNNPDESVAIPALTSGEVVLFRRGGASLTNLCSASVIDTEVCKFTGNDIILISISAGSNAYNDRIDIMGDVGVSVAINWGTNISLIKGCGTSEVPTIVYDSITIEYDNNQYIELTLTEVDNAVANTNIQLGTQTVGSTTWTSSWSNNIPDKTKNAIISGSYSGVSFEACNLTVDGSVTLNSGSTNYVLVENNLTINGSVTIGDTESLITVNPDGIITGSIQKNESSTALNNFRDFTYWSSPVSTTIASAFSGVDPNRILEFDTANEEWDVASGSMIVATGYIAEAPASTPDGGTHSVTFSGTPHNGTIEKSIVFNNNADPEDDYNLIGNPYPSAIDIERFILLDDNDEINNNNMSGTIWLWTHVTAISNGTTGEFLGDDYATYNLSGGVGTGSGSGSGSATPTKNIGSGQGFFIRHLGIDDNRIFFQNDMRLKDENNQFFRAPDTKSMTADEKDRIWLNVESNTGGAFNQLLVGFFDQATDGVDRGYDGSKFGRAWISFYSTIDDAKYAIQGLSNFNIDKKVPLGFDTYIDQLMTYKMSIDNIEGVLNDNDIYIVDNELGITHDLKLADYEFEIDGSGNFPDRFTLQFTSSVLEIDDLSLNNDFIITNEENALQLRSTTVITDLKVYDMMGRLLIDSKPNDSNFSINTNTIKKGTVLILNVTFDNGAEVSKKAIRY
ncbi:MAG: choice-of-anchor D domain-containing protein [Flavobacteriaceae bacterium]|nr:choice-of-anchor D domain-containing protein [Flavobacteriaceae bacterium]